MGVFTGTAMHKKPLALLALLALLLIALAVRWWRAEEVVYYQYNGQNYKVVRWEVQNARNVLVTSDWAYKQWGRRQLDRIGLHLKGSRSDDPFNMGSYEDKRHVLMLLCEGSFPPSFYTGQTAQELQDETGRKLVFGPTGYKSGPPGHVWFFWNYRTHLRSNFVSWIDPRSGLTNLAPREFRIVSKPDEKEILRLRVKD